MKKKILIVEDDAAKRKLYRSILEEDHCCIEAQDGDEGFTLAKKHKPDLIITDACMPKIDGFLLCELIREIPSLSKIPVIILTSQRTSDTDVMSGYDHGAYDYLSKSIKPGILQRKVKAILGRDISTEAEETMFSANGITIDLARRTVKVDKKNLKLPRKEFDLLAILMKANGKVLSTGILLGQIWGHDPAVYNDPHTVKTQISTLKKKLGPKGKAHIINVPGLGYKFD